MLEISKARLQSEVGWTGERSRSAEEMKGGGASNDDGYIYIKGSSPLSSKVFG